MRFGLFPWTQLYERRVVNEMLNAQVGTNPWIELVKIMIMVSEACIKLP
ncbi:MAG: hypothetical protein JWN25_3230 [Verrucomicrobiales bacterium]|nr:hypothetical protein [Verrucomicrobiales bacterium]